MTPTTAKVSYPTLSLEFLSPLEALGKCPSSNSNVRLYRKKQVVEWCHDHDPSPQHLHLLPLVRRVSYSSLPLVVHHLVILVSETTLVLVPPVTVVVVVKVAIQVQHQSK